MNTALLTLLFATLIIWSTGNHQGARTDNLLTMALVRACRSREAIEQRPVKSINLRARDANLDRRRVHEILRLSTIAPDTQRAIIEDHHPENLTLERIIQIGPPLSGAEERRLLGLPNKLLTRSRRGFSENRPTIYPRRAETDIVAPQLVERTHSHAARPLKTA